MKLTKEQMASMIDHTLLKQDATKEGLRKLCEEARENQFASVCVNPCNVGFCYQILKDTSVKVCTVIGFPLGANTPEVKAYETKKAIEDGATEVDMVINVGRIKDNDWDYVKEDIASVVAAAKGKALTKVILEICLLTDEEIEKASRVAKEAGADFVKTSTGFSTGGATESAVQIMRKTVGPDMGVKAAGGIRTTEDAVKMVEAGANRIGASAGIKIIAGMEE